MKVILPLPKSTERNNRSVRKKVKTRIVTDTPEKMELELTKKNKIKMLNRKKQRIKERK